VDELELEEELAHPVAAKTSPAALTARPARRILIWDMPLL
jgi:hypothetical protein